LFLANTSPPKIFTKNRFSPADAVPQTGAGRHGGGQHLSGRGPRSSSMAQCWQGELYSCIVRLALAAALQLRWGKGERAKTLSLQEPGSGQVQCTSRRNLSLCIYMYDVCTHHVTARVHVADSVHAGGAGTSNLTRISHDLHVLGLCLPAISIQYSVICLRGNCVIRRTQKVIQGDDNGHVGRPC
jgi:hypothetical protein